MATERLPMQQLREILRQKLALGRSHRQVARALSINPSTVAGAFAGARSLGLDAAAVEAITEVELEAKLYPKSAPSCMRPEPDYASLHIELRRPGVTPALLHVEFFTAHPDGVRYTAFCERYRTWAKRRSPVMRQVHVASDKRFVDYAGMRPRLVDPVTGKVTEVELFVAVLGASNYTYAEALVSVMARVGYEGATVVAVAEEAGLAPGLIHYHFANTQQILVAVVEHLSRRLETRVEERLEHAGKDPKRRVHALVDAYVALGKDAAARAVSACVLIGADAVRQEEVRDLYRSALARSLDLLRTEVGDYLRSEGRSARNAGKIAAAVLSAMLSAIEGSYQIAVGAPGLLPVGFAAPTLCRMVDGLVIAEDARS